LERTAGTACHGTSPPPTTPLQQVCSPEDPLITTVQPTPQEAYELGMHSPPAWLGESLCTCSRASWALLPCADKLEVLRREDTEQGVRATAAFQEGSFVCEFEADVLTKAQFEVAEKEYQEQNIPVYGLQVQLQPSSLMNTLSLFNSCHRLTATTSTPPVIYKPWEDTSIMLQWELT
jgi:hypothetical protein